MSQLAHPSVTLRDHRRVVSAALLALAATAAIVLVLAIGDSSDNSASTSASDGTQSGVRYDGGPEEGRSLAQPGVNVRYDGGPEEGSAAQTLTLGNR